MSGLDDARELLEAFTDFADDTAGSSYTPSAQRPVRLATVDPAFAAGSPKVTFDGELTMSTKGYPFLGAAPRPGQRVAMLPVGRGYLILPGGVDGAGDTYLGTVDAAWTVGKPNVTLSDATVVSAFVSPLDPGVQPGSTVVVRRSVGGVWIILGAYSAGPAFPRWVPLTLGAGWAWYTSFVYNGSQGWLFSQPGVSRTAAGYVEVKGEIARSATVGAGSVLATLPVGFRPLVAHRFNLWSSGTTLSVEVQTNGNIVALATTGTDVSLDGIRFNNDPALAWTALTYLGTWSDMGGGAPGGAYAKDAIGRVYNRGQIKGGAATPVYTTPAAIKQNAALGTNIFHGVLGTGTINRIDVSTSASQFQEVYSTAGVGAGPLAIDPVSWLADGFSADPTLAASFHFNSVGYHVFPFNSGANYGSGFTGRRVTKTADGMVKFGGLIQSLGVGGVLMYLPPGMRPAGVRLFATEAVDTIGAWQVYPNGAVVYAAGPTTWISLDSIQFLAEQ